MLVGAILYDNLYLAPRGGFGATLLVLVMFGPISFLLWLKENLRDCNSRALLKFCLRGVLGAVGVGAVYAGGGFLNGLISPQPGLTGFDAFAAFKVFLVVGALIPVFVAFTFLRLGITRLLERLFRWTES